ncbi:hypothetical protein [Streptococcus phocae]|uniref:DUF2178 domain-containing protein n=1 Tax=Streptococcus phocae TaxID=119224 RepID=A0A0P6SJG8_9STRE|nr:hypothetical protein [Streptococcus phocae]KPJ22420.1 hypothetical protein AKK44_04860 [Streptococcus phocae]
MKKKVSQWQYIYKMLGHIFVALGLFLGVLGFFLLIQQKLIGVVLFLGGAICLIFASLCYYVFSEPISLKEHLIQVNDERNRLINQRTAAYCFYIFFIVFLLAPLLFPNLTLKEVVSYKVPIIFCYIYLLIRSWLLNRM